MSLNEEELQRSILDGRELDDADVNVKSYRMVFDALSKEPAAGLSPAFADKVIQKVLAKNQKESSRDMWWLGFGLFLMVIALVVCVAWVGVNFNLGFLSGMSNYSGLLGAAIILITIFNVVDRKLVRAKHEI